MARPRGSQSKRTKAIEAEKVKVLAEFAAVKPRFDPLEQLEKIAIHFMAQVNEERMKGKDASQKVINELLDRAARVLKDITPYRHARLGSMDVRFPGLDLSKLNHEQLATFEQLVAAASLAADQARDREASH